MPLYFMMVCELFVFRVSSFKPSTFKPSAHQQLPVLTVTVTQLGSLPSICSRQPYTQSMVTVKIDSCDKDFMPTDIVA